MRARVPFASLGLAAAVAVFSPAAGQTPGPAGSSPQLVARPAFGGTAPTYERKGRRDPFEPVQIGRAHV